ncbi:hypothetical protein EQP59_10345 [Ornithobacterium rhinotracheale]|uniref:Uncharacterized protein n=1 Tax=Ornithobacterium rhinotracheale TaxID=28251 RepID=A0A410JUJ2_ORNRH|nr:DUF6078 family protein [Ornithobacterium rhinotracheale]QAR31708.1 hypothetical protein EQP59_10345 [Ornithobacterium rhinotracheale]
MENHLTLSPEQIPASYTRCFQQECPKASHCLRFLAGKQIPNAQLSGQAVYPTARQGDTCKMFRQVRIIRAAYGFKSLFAEVKRKDSTDLRRSIIAYLGGESAYYRYHRGDRWLTPEQQEWIFEHLRKQGYTEQLQFDVYQEMYDFSKG